MTIQQEAIQLINGMPEDSIMVDCRSVKIEPQGERFA